MAAGAQLVDERVGEDLGSPAREGHLGPADGDPHGLRARLRRAELRHLRLQPVDLLLQVVDEPQRGRVEGALVVGERLDVPAHHLAQHGLDRSADAAADARPQPQRPVGGDGPQALGLVPRSAAVTGVATTAGIGTAAPYLSRSDAKSAATSTCSTGAPSAREPFSSASVGIGAV